MIDFDLASLYGTETKYLKRSVKNNLKRFPSDFMFELTKEERDFLRCNFCTLKEGRGNHPTKHVCNIYLSEELYREATVSKMEIVRQEGNRSVRRILRKWFCVNLGATITLKHFVIQSEAKNLGNI